MKEISLIKIRKLISDYMYAEGCSCCRSDDLHTKTKKSIAKLLNVPMYSDKSGYDFSKFRSKKG